MYKRQALAGLVAITAGCDVVDPFGAAVIGIVAGVLCIFSVEFFDKIAKICLLYTSIAGLGNLLKCRVHSNSFC